MSKRTFLLLGSMMLLLLLFLEVTTVAFLKIFQQTGTPQSIERSQYNKKKKGKAKENSMSAESSVKANQAKSTTAKKDEPAQETMKPAYTKSVAITFDDGPNAATTPQLLQILKEKKVHASFFVLGDKIEKHPDITKKAIENGNEIGSHTFDHQDLSKLSVAEITAEITKADEEIRKSIGERPAYVRPPYGSITSEGARIINRPIIEWSVDSQDWKTRNPELIVRQVEETVYDGAIILFHDIYEETVAAIPQIIDYLHSQGYQLLTVGELLDHPTAAENYYGRNDHRPS